MEVAVAVEVEVLGAEVMDGQAAWRWLGLWHGSVDRRKRKRRRERGGERGRGGGGGGGGVELPASA